MIRGYFLTYPRFDGDTFQRAPFVAWILKGGVQSLLNRALLRQVGRIGSRNFKVLRCGRQFLGKCGEWWVGNIAFDQLGHASVELSDAALAR